MHFWKKKIIILSIKQQIKLHFSFTLRNRRLCFCCLQFRWLHDEPDNIWRSSCKSIHELLTVIDILPRYCMYPCWSLCCGEAAVCRLLKTLYHFIITKSLFSLLIYLLSLLIGICKMLEITNYITSQSSGWRLQMTFFFFFYFLPAAQNPEILYLQIIIKTEKSSKWSHFLNEKIF